METQIPNNRTFDRHDGFDKHRLRSKQLDIDPSYLQSDHSMEAWFFLNHQGLITCYRVCELLRVTKSLKEYSVCGVQQVYLSGIQIDKITGY